MKLLLCVQLSQAASRWEATLYDREQRSLLLVGFLQGSYLKSCTELCVESWRGSHVAQFTQPSLSQHVAALLTALVSLCPW